jgi:hypothetical protein
MQHERGAGAACAGAGRAIAPQRASIQAHADPAFLVELVARQLRAQLFAKAESAPVALAAAREGIGDCQRRDAERAGTGQRAICKQARAQRRQRVRDGRPVRQYEHHRGQANDPQGQLAATGDERAHTKKKHERAPAQEKMPDHQRQRRRQQRRRAGQI